MKYLIITILVVVILGIAAAFWQQWSIYISVPPVVGDISDRLQQTQQEIQDAVKEEEAKQAAKVSARRDCQLLCQQTLFSDGEDFDQGPCLSNNIAPDWVCDVAHNPRQPIDNDPANQCEAFLAGQAHHFVEVDGNCNVIRTQ